MATPRDTRSAPVLPADLTAAIERAGYYPALVADVVESALGPDAVASVPPAVALLDFALSDSYEELVSALDAGS